MCFFPDDHKLCKKKKDMYWFAGGCHSKITQTGKFNRHAFSYTSGSCMFKGRGFSGFLMRSLCFAYRWCLLSLASYSCLFCRRLMMFVCVLISYYKNAIHIGLESTQWIAF